MPVALAGTAGIALDRLLGVTFAFSLLLSVIAYLVATESIVDSVAVFRRTVGAKGGLVGPLAPQECHGCFPILEHRNTHREVPFVQGFAHPLGGQPVR